MKCVIIIDRDLPAGLIANTSAALGISLAGTTGDLTGKDISDRDGRVHHGLTSIPIPVLELDQAALKEWYDSAIADRDSELKIIGFSDIAQGSLSYDDYEDKLSEKGKDDITYLGVCVYGPRKKVNRLTGNLKMLR